MTEQRVREALEQRAARVDPDVDSLWARIEERLDAPDPRPGRHRPSRWLPALAAAAVVTAVVGAGVAGLDDDPPPAPSEAASNTAPTPPVPTPSPRPEPEIYPFDRYRLDPTFGGREPINRDTVRRIDGNLVRGEVVLLDVRPGEPPPRRTPVVGPTFTYAYPCVGIDSAPVCLTRISTGTFATMGPRTTSLSRFAQQTDRLRIQRWQSARGKGDGPIFVAYAAPADARSARFAIGGDPPKAATRIVGDDWPLTLFVALGPPGESVVVEAALADGRTEGVHTHLFTG